MLWEHIQKHDLPVQILRQHHGRHADVAMDKFALIIQEADRLRNLPHTHGQEHLPATQHDQQIKFQSL